MSFQRDGFLVLRDALDRNKLRDLRDTLRAALGEKSALLSDAVLAAEATDHQRVYDAGIAAGSSTAAYELLGGSGLGALGSTLLNVPRFDIHFLPLVVSIQIPQVETYDYHWHQESAFYPWCPSVLSVWFPVLDASTREGGTMTVIPGSHVGGRRGEALYTDSAEFKQVEPELLPGEAESAVAVEIGLGDAVVFDANLVHASLPNRGVRPRVTGILRIINQRDLDRYQPLVRALLR